jgi:predicted nucleotidyltransferase
MRRLGARWYVFGAQAAIVYGRPRMTADVDVTVDAGQMSTPALVDELSRAGFSLRASLSDDFLREARLLPLVHDATMMPLDLMLATTRMHAEILERSRLTDVGGVHVPVMSPEDVIITKVLAGRSRDLDDVRGILGEQRDLDLAHVREALADLEAALDEPRFVRRFERLLRAVRRGE